MFKTKGVGQPCALIDQAKGFHGEKKKKGAEVPHHLLTLAYFEVYTRYPLLLQPLIRVEVSLQDTQKDEE